MSQLIVKELGRLYQRFGVVWIELNTPLIVSFSLPVIFQVAIAKSSILIIDTFLRIFFYGLVKTIQGFSIAETIQKY